MKQIVFYGDSNTWGYNAENGGRFSLEERFTGILTTRMTDCHICEEGLCGRTAVAEDDLAEMRSGQRYLAAILNTHDPIDLLVLMLGTNDTKPKFALRPAEIAYGVEELLRIVRSPLVWHGAKSPEVLLISPIEVGEQVCGTAMGGEFDLTAVERSRALAAELVPVAERYGCHFLDAAQVARPCALDAVHLDREGHRRMADALEPMIRAILAK